MDKVFLTSEDIEYLLQWRDEHKELVRMSPAPMKAIEIVCSDSGYRIKGVRIGDELKLNVSHNGMGLGNVKFRKRDDGLWEKIRDKTRLPVEDGVQSLLTVYGSLMALMVYGQMTISGSNDVPRLEAPEKAKKVVDNRAKKHDKKRSKPSVTYILRRDKNGISVVTKGYHASPNGTFSVRGHYRRYKSGRVIWIEEFQKGSGKKKNKTYKVGNKDGGSDALDEG